MTKTPHFFKAHSRLGMINVPYRKTIPNIGVEDGPDAVLSDNFLKKFEHFEISKFVFTKPEKLNGRDSKKVITYELKKFKDLITRKLKNNHVQIVVGGDHSVSFPSLASLIEKHQANQIGYVQFDSHGDCHTFKTSPSGNFHGMFLRPFIDDFDNEEISKLVRQKLPAKNILFIGNLDLEIDERKFFEEKKIANITRAHVISSRRETLKKFKIFVDSFKHLHVSFDVDILDKSIVSATGLPSENGFFLDEVLPFIKQIQKHPSVSLDLVEVNPHVGNAQETIKIARRVLSLILRMHQ